MWAPSCCWYREAVSRAALTVIPSLEDAVSSSWDGGGSWGCPVVSAVGAGPSASPDTRSKKCNLGVR